MNINMALNRLAFFLIALLLLLILLSAVIPQQDIASGQAVDWQELLGEHYSVVQKLGLDRIYYTPVFFIVLALFGLTLLWVNVRRFRLIYKSTNNLFRLRYLGSVIFHLSLLVIIAGITLNFLYKYEGVMALTEGQQAHDSPDEYFREFKGPLYKDDYGKFILRLDTLSRMSDPSDPSGIAAITLTPAPGNARTAAISPNHPYNWRGSEFHIGQNVGYSPEIQILDLGDSSLFRAFMRVAIVAEGDRQIDRDFIQVPDLDMRLEIEIIAPDSTAPTYRYPVVLQQNDSAAWETILTPGDTAEFDNVKITIPRMRNWCYIGFVKSPYLGSVFFGFWAALSGMALGFLSRLASTGGKS